MTDQEREAVIDRLHPLTVLMCGTMKKPTDHTCNISGPIMKIGDCVESGSCSICGHPAFDDWGIFDD